MPSPSGGCSAVPRRTGNPPRASPAGAGPPLSDAAALSQGSNLLVVHAQLAQYGRSIGARLGRVHQARRQPAEAHREAAQAEAAVGPYDLGEQVAVARLG